MRKKGLNDSKARVEELEKELKILLLPKDPNDDKNVIVEIVQVPAVTRLLYLRLNLSYVSALCRKQKLEDGDHGSR